MEIEWVDSLLEEIAELRDMIRDLESGISGGYEKETEEEDEEYSESFEGDLKEYQERFRKYAENLKKDLPKLYEPREAEKSEMAYAEMGKEKEGIKTPWERGHKLGCGCPGCTKYRELHGISLEKFGQNNDLKFPDIRFASKKSDKIEEYKESGRPCGGKHYHFFHGRRAEFKGLFGDYRKKLNLNLAGY